MYLQEVLFKLSWILASEWDVCLMDAFFFFSAYVHSNKRDICIPLCDQKISLHSERLGQNFNESINFLDRIVMNQRNADQAFVHVYLGFERVH